MKKILVTGAAGFIGWKTSEKLVEKGFEVVGIDNMNDYYDVRLKEWRLNQLLPHKNFRFYKIDIEDRESLKDLFKSHKFDAIINLAARAGVRYSLVNPYIYYRTNVMGTLNLLELAKILDIPKFILASTSSLYAGQPMPFKEDLPVNKPISPYAASKKASEVLCYTYHYLYGIDVTVLRYFTVYGPAGRPDMSIFRFIKWVIEGKPVQIYGDGSQSRDFTYVDDIAEGTIKGMKGLNFEVINLGGGRNPISLNNLLKIIEKYTGKAAIRSYSNFKKGDLKSTWANIDKAEKILGWKPKVSIEKGIENTVKWFIDNWEYVKSIVVNGESK